MSNTPGVADHAAQPAPAVLEAPADVAEALTASAIEPKVSAATVASGGAAAVVLPFVLWLLSTYVFGGAVPLPVQGFAGLIVAGGLTFAAGYRARHVDRVPAGS